jgi:myo-inositol-1(or 4)-monophosphatase
MKEVLIKALQEAGKIQRDNFNKVHTIDQKESISSIVTEIDILCDKVITDIIRQAYPLHTILTEESGLADTGSKYTWVVDPLDGTSNFAAGIPWFGVLIAVFENNQPIIAGAYLPVDDLLYVAESGRGAFVNGKKLTIENKLLKNELVAFSVDYTDDEVFLKRGLEAYRYVIEHARNTRCTNSLVDLLLVAEGKFGGVINLFAKIWDVAAPYLIIKEAGGIMTNINGTSLVFHLSKENIGLNYPIIAGSEAIHKELGIVQNIFSGQ